MHLKKYIGIFMIILLFVLAACGGNENVNEENTNANEQDDVANDVSNDNNDANDKEDANNENDELDLVEPDNRIKSIQEKGETVDGDGSDEITTIEIGETVFDEDGVKVELDYILHNWIRLAALEHEDYQFFFTVTNEIDDFVEVSIRDFYIDDVLLDHYTDEFTPSTSFFSSGVDDNYLHTFEMDDGEELPDLVGTLTFDITVDHDLEKPYAEEKISLELDF